MERFKSETSACNVWPSIKKLFPHYVFFCRFGKKWLDVELNCVMLKTYSALDFIVHQHQTVRNVTNTCFFFIGIGLI